MHLIKKSSPALALVLAVGALTIAIHPARADFLGPSDSPKQPGDVMVRGRALVVAPDVSSTVSTIGGHVDAETVAVPEVDLSYFLTANIAFELIAATTRHSVQDNGSALGNVGLGKVSLLPPTLTAQYHFMPQSRLSPYVGAGINYTFFYDAKAPGGTISSIRYDDNVGAALQAGVDYNIAGNWFANLDLKKLFLSTKAHVNGGAVTASVDLDPWLVGVGVGYKF